jgi:hypothetical protein
VTPRLAQFTEMWKGGLGRTLPRWLAQRGWQVRLEDRDPIADAYGRPSPVPSDGGYLIFAHRRLNKAWHATQIRIQTTTSAIRPRHEGRGERTGATT